MRPIGQATMSRQNWDAPPCRKLSADWNALLEQFDAREILHVTFGSVLTEKTIDGRWLFRERLVNFLQANQEAYAANLERHFIRHLTPFLPG